MFLKKYGAIVVVTVFGLAAVACTPKSEPSAANTASTLEQPSVASEAHAADQTVGFVYSAFGNEPDWTVQVKRDNSLTFATPQNLMGVTMRAERSANAKGAEYTGQHEGKSFHLTLDGRTPCQDTMQDSNYDMTATFEYDGQKYMGCAKTVAAQ